jgi:UDP-N-acetylmuramoyl-L-alanyl-D-glutamate--2,6-diaminopimelate ligase
MPVSPGPAAVVGDRAIAIQTAIALAQPGDGILIAGKGHEDYQILGTEKIHFDDREQADHFLRDRYCR